eukprot:scaffold106778_cov65-Phaeocystis_antarctica.AAC.1
MPSFRLSAERVGVQPAAELRYLQRHKYGLHAQGALLPVPCTQSGSRTLPCTLDSVAPVCWPAASPRTVWPPFDSRQYASAFNQPLSFDTSSVTAMNAMFMVRSSPCPATNLQSRPLLQLRAPRSSIACCRPTCIPRPAPPALLLTLGRARRRPTSR